MRPAATERDLNWKWKWMGALYLQQSRGKPASARASRASRLAEARATPLMRAVGRPAGIKKIVDKMNWTERDREREANCTVAKWVPAFDGWQIQ